MQQEDLSGLCFCSRHQRLRQPRQATQGRHKKVCQNMFLVRTLKSRRKDGERGAVEPRSRCNGRLETPPVPTADLAHVARWGADSARASTVCSTHVAESLGSGLSGKASPLPGACSHTCQHPQHPQLTFRRCSCKQNKTGNTALQGRQKRTHLANKDSIVGAGGCGTRKPPLANSSGVCPCLSM